MLSSGGGGDDGRVKRWVKRKKAINMEFVWVGSLCFRCLFSFFYDWDKFKIESKYEKKFHGNFSRN